MNLKSQLKLKTKNSRRVGRGPGSGRGKTSGRGTKGQKARGKVSIYHPHFEGGQRPLFKRLPYRRGKGNSKISKKPIVINLGALEIINKGEIVSVDTLIKYRIVDKLQAKTYGVKILGGSEVSAAYTIQNIKLSKSAAEKIEKAKGKIIFENKKA